MAQKPRRALDCLYHPYIPESSLSNLPKYQYQAADFSFISNYVLQPVWTKLSTFLPSWLAPNLITFFGFLFCLAMYLLNVYYSPTLTETVPTWLYAFNFISILAYQTMDALDGKQARQTQTGSPLGELFDHGCDSFAVFFVLISSASTFRSGTGAPTYLGIVLIVLSFYTTQLEDYFTNVLTLGYFDATEGQVIAMVLNLVAFFKGPQAFSQPVPLLAPLAFSDLLIYVCIAVGALHVASNLWQIFKVVKLDERLIVEASQCLMPTCMFVLFATTWYFIERASTSTNAHLYFIMLTMAFANLTSRTIVARICQLKASSAHLYLFIPMLVGTIHADMGCPAMSNRSMIIAVLCVYMAIYLHYALSVIHQITTYLRIQCFSIRAAPQRASQQPLALDKIE